MASMCKREIKIINCTLLKKTNITNLDQKLYIFVLRLSCLYEQIHQTHIYLLYMLCSIAITSTCWTEDTVCCKCGHPWSLNILLCFQSSLLSDKFKRPFKKRHSSLPHAPSNRVNKYLAQAIEARSVDREKSTHVSLVTLCFRDKQKERHVSRNY